MEGRKTTRIGLAELDRTNSQNHQPTRSHALGKDLGEGRPLMFHVTCDLCGKELRPGDDQRYVVKVEVYAAHDPAEITEADLDEDHMEAVSQLLREMDENGSDDLEGTQATIRYDICAPCRARFARDPLGREIAQKFDFSEN